MNRQHKHYTITFCLVLIFSLSNTTGYSQGNLEFNQVLVLSVPASGGVTVNNTNPLATISLTVPAGKVWKIESASLLEIGAGVKRPPNTAGVSFDFNNFVLLGRDSFGLLKADFPIWVPEGTYNLNINTCCSATCSNCQGKISVIEFNIVP
jgi:hypothetical protein